jgi:ABC-2 type transport system ATP-binding protein
MATVSLQNVSKWYGEVIGVSDVTSEIRPGVTGLLGPNGAGKTTLFKLLTGLMKVDTGSINVDGQPVWNNPDIFHTVGMCPSSEALYEQLTGLEFLTYMGRLHGNSSRAARERAMQTLEEVGLSDAVNKPIGAYSKGMRQRVKFAQSIQHDPQVLLFDEPLSGMDPLGRHAVVQRIKHYGETGKTVIVSSHILHEVEEMTNRILLLNNGMLLAEGVVQEIRELIEEQPRHVQIVSTEMRRLSNRLIEFPEVKTIRFGEDPNELIVQTHSPDLFFPKLTHLILDEDIPVTQMNTLDDNLQSVFEYLVK